MTNVQFYMIHLQKIIILDFGSQYTQLIARRIRESKVYSEIHSHSFTIEKIKEEKPAGIILSGGPMSVNDVGSPKISKEIFELGIPILGICYGLQLMSKVLGGKVEPADDREYGKAHLEILEDEILFQGVKNSSVIWMSHGDYVTELPEGFHVTAKTENSPLCAISN
ncbi:MAG: glutamine-hydrolyzing GMP synthase, partial [Bacteroidota bacterium]